MTGSATIEVPRQRELNFAPRSRFNARQFDLAALECACSVIKSVYAVAHSYLDRNVKDMGPPAHYEPPCVKAWQLAIADRAAGIRSDELGFRHPSQDLVPLMLEQVPFERALLVAEDTLHRGWCSERLWQYLMLGRWEPPMRRAEVLRLVLRKRGSVA